MSPRTGPKYFIDGEYAPPLEPKKTTKRERRKKREEDRKEREEREQRAGVEEEAESDVEQYRETIPRRRDRPSRREEIPRRPPQKPSPPPSPTQEADGFFESRARKDTPTRAFSLQDQDLDDVRERDLFGPDELTAEDRMRLTQTWGALAGQLELKFQDIEKFYTQHFRTPIQVTVGKRRGAAERAREEGDFFKGWGYDIAAHFSKAGLGALGVVTTPARPGAVIGALTGPFKLLKDKEARKYAITRYKGDPHGALAYAGGAYLGGRLLGLGIEKAREFEMRRALSKFTEEDWLPYESTHPQPTSTIYETWALEAEEAQMADDFTSQMMVKGGYELKDVMQTLDSKWLKKKGYVRTGHDVIPMQIPKGMGTTQKVLKQVRKGISIRTDAWGRYAYGLPTGGKVRGISELGGLIGLASVLRTGDRTLEKQTSEILGKTKTDLWKDPIERIGDLPATISRPGKVTTPRIIDLLGYTQKTRTWTTPGFIQEQIQEQRQRTRGIQEVLQIPKQEAPTTTIARLFADPRKPSVRAQPPLRRKKKRKRGFWDPLFGYEQRVYPSGLSSFFEPSARASERLFGLGGTKRKKATRKKPKRKTRRKKRR